MPSTFFDLACTVFHCTGFPPQTRFVISLVPPTKTTRKRCQGNLFVGARGSREARTLYPVRCTQWQKFAFEQNIFQAAEGGEGRRSKSRRRQKTTFACHPCLVSQGCCTKKRRNNIFWWRCTSPTMAGKNNDCRQTNARTVYNIKYINF